MLIELIGRQVNFPTDLKFVEGGTQKAITEAALQVERGEIHLMAVTGLEFGWWLALPHGRPEILVLCDPGGEVNQYQELVVRGDRPYKSPEDLLGASLAEYPRTAPSCPIYLQQLRTRGGGGVLAGPTVDVAHAAEAMHAVFDAKADAAIVDVYARLRFDKAFKGRMKQLQVIDRSPPYPLPVVAGNRLLIERLRPGLWKQFQATMLQIHTQADAQAFLDVWAQRGFNEAPANYSKLAKAAAVEYPFSALPVGR